MSGTESLEIYASICDGPVESLLLYGRNLKESFLLDNPSLGMVLLFCAENLNRCALNWCVRFFVTMRNVISHSSNIILYK